MAQITWRNVANTVTGNPAAALSSASSAFASAGVGAQRLLTNSLERQKLERAQTTDDALQSIFGEGDLAGIDQDANFGAILKAQQDKLTGDAQIGANQAAQAAAEQRLAVSKLDNSPEARRIKDERAQAQLENDQARLGISRATEQRQTNAYNLLAKDAEDLRQNDEAWDIHFGEATKDIRAEQTRLIDEITNNPDLNIGQRQKQIEAVKKKADAATEDVRQNEALRFTSKLKVENPGVSTKGRAFDIADLLSKEGRDRENLRNKAEIEFQQKQRNQLKGFFGTTTSTSLAGMGLGAGGEPYSLETDGAIADNTITGSQAIADVEDLARLNNSNHFGIDDNMPVRYQRKVKAIVKAVGGNKEIFDEVMVNVDYNRDTAFFGFGGEDDVTGLPDINDVRKIVEAYKTKARKIYEGQKPEEARNVQDDFFNQGTSTPNVDIAEIAKTYGGTIQR